MTERWGLSRCLAVLGLLVLFGTASPAAAQDVDPFVGEAMCLACHADTHEALLATPHGSDDFQALAEQTCQSCHGPGRAHVQDAEDLALQPRIEGTEALQTLCLSCHGDVAAHAESHAAADVSCTSCHAVHEWETGVTAAGGQQACLSCHWAKAEGEAVAAHASRQPFDETFHLTAGLSCTSCHDTEALAGRIETGPAGAPACLTCHRDTHPRFAASPHALLGCTSCHAVHELADDPAELRETDPFFTLGRATGPSALCVECHEDVGAVFELNTRHRLQEGALDCTSCHDPHEPSERFSLGGFKQQLCVSCHADKEGPFVFEHASQRVEGCIACHDPHGSPNRHLLLYQNIGDLCYSCHTHVPSFHLRWDRDRDCLSCHYSIHGSNVDPAFFN